MNISTILRKSIVISIFLSLTGMVNAQLDCNPDVQGPIITCNNQSTYLIMDNEPAIVPADFIVASVSDNCTAPEDIQLFISDPSQETPPADTVITFPAGSIGNFAVKVWAVDEAGLFGVCWGTITLTSWNEACSIDITPPIAICDVDLNLIASGSDQIITAAELDDGSYDLCTPEDSLGLFATLDWQDTAIPTTTSITIPANTIGEFIAALWVIDQAGNTNQCYMNITVTGSSEDCENDTIPPFANCYAPTIVLPPHQSATINAYWFSINSWDNCTAEDDLQYFISQDSTLTSPPTTDSVFIPANSDTLLFYYLWVMDEAGLFSSCESYLNVKQSHLKNGKIFNDENQNCLLDENENGIENYAIRYTYNDGLTYNTAFSDADGYYYLDRILWLPAGSGLPFPWEEVTLELMLPDGNSSSCITSVTVPLPLDTFTTLENALNFPLELATDCNSMIVDIAAPFLRRCFPTTYTTTYCNNSAFAIDDVEIVVTLPPEMAIENVGLPYTNLGNNQLLIELGTVPAGFCNYFPIQVILDCTTPLGATKCVQAAISPNDCQQPDPSWSGADLVVTGNCEESIDSVIFKIENIGTGTMQEAKPAIVIEDVIMYFQDPIQLGPGEFEELSFAANGSTWRVQIPQEFGHPSLSNPMAVIEGCGGFGSMGQINQFPMPDLDPYLSIDCQEVIGSYDPNDKAVFPAGYGNENMVEPNTSLEYKIRFQNTGNDTAFTVRLEDQLSEHLDYSTIQVGTSSHPYRMELQEDGLLIFHFENILLPDSTVNEAESHGFVQFRIEQKLDNPIGTVINNQAAIYFDFNDPILTNMPFVTLGYNPIIDGTSQIFVPDLKVSVVPNPFNVQTQFTLYDWQGQNPTFELYNILGQKIITKQLTGNQYTLARKEMSSGIYFYRFLADNNVLATGKIEIQ